MDDLEPLFDYKRVQHVINIFDIDDDDCDPVPLPARKRPKTDIDDDDVEIVETVNNKVDLDEEDWLPPPPKIHHDSQNQRGEDSTLKELRLKKQELQAFIAKSAKDICQAAEESAKRERNGSLQASLEAVADKPSKPPCERAKIVISIQDKDAVKQYRVYKDEKFERFFQNYANKVNVEVKNLVFSFDGEKISPTATPDGLGMEDEDIIEVYTKKS